MTVTNQTNKVTYTGNGATTNFPFAFRVDDEDYLIVTRITIASGVRTVISPNDYTVNGIGVDAGGSVDYSPALSVLYQIELKREVPLTQTVDIQNQGGFLPEVVEGQLDNMVMADIQLKNYVDEQIALIEGFEDIQAIEDAVAAAEASAAAAAADAVLTAADVVQTAADVVAADAAAAAAEGFATDAETASDIALGAAGIYADTTDGLAGTSVGDYFYVVGTGEVAYELYLHETGPVATLIKSIYNSVYINHLNPDEPIQNTYDTTSVINPNHVLIAEAASATNNVRWQLRETVAEEVIIQAYVLASGSGPTLQLQMRLNNVVKGTAQTIEVDGRLHVYEMEVPLASSGVNQMQFNTVGANADFDIQFWAFEAGTGSIIKDLLDQLVSPSNSDPVGPYLITGLLRAFDALDAKVAPGDYVREWPSQDGTLVAEQLDTALQPFVRGRDQSLDFHGTGYMHALPYVSEPRVYPLPDSPIAANPNGGFTCTGLTRDDKLRWIVACDGRTSTSDLTYSPHIVILSYDFTRIISTIDLSAIPSIQSVQGVTYDTSDGTIWIVDKTNKTIWHYTLAGVDLGDEIVVTQAPNGVAYDAVNDTLFVSNTDNSTIEVRSCVDGTQVSTFTFPTSAIDHIAYDGRYIYCSITNGTDDTGDVWVSTTDGKLVHRYASLPFCGSHEGIYIEDGKMWLSNDGGFHVDSIPPVSMVLEFDIVDLPDNACPATLLWSGLISRIDTANTGVIQAFYDPTNLTGWGLYFVSAVNSIRLIGRNSNADVTNTITWPCDAVTDTVLLALEVTDEATFNLYVNGVLATPSATTNDMINYTRGWSVASMSFNAEYQGQLPGKTRIFGLIMGSDLAEREKAEGYLAWRHDRVDLLPDLHTYKTVSP